MGKNDNIVIEAHVQSPVEAKIKDGISAFKIKKDKLKEKRKELEKALMEDEKYHNAKIIISETNQAKKEERERILRENSDLQELNNEITKLSEEMKNEQLNIFDWLLDFHNKTGKKVIIDHAGERHDINIEASTDL